MFIDWTCVYDDGSAPVAAGLAVDQRRPLRISSNEDVTIRIAVLGPSGAPRALASGEVLVLDVATPGPKPKKILRKKSAHPAGIAPHRQVIQIAAADTGYQGAKRGTFELAAVNGANRVVLIPLSEFEMSTTDGAV